MSAVRLTSPNARTAACRSRITGDERSCAATSAATIAEAPRACPEPACRNPAIRYAGLGTEKVEERWSRIFPHGAHGAHGFRHDEAEGRLPAHPLAISAPGKIDILVGTQMIAKGLHFPNVTLVGIIHADLSLHMPDFRAGERTFQLLTQVAGRAGRGDVEGEVFVQAFTPFHPAIQYARRHDFLAFTNRKSNSASNSSIRPSAGSLC